MHKHIEKNTIAVAAIAAIVLMAGSFYAGRMTASSGPATDAGGFAGRNGGPGGRSGGPRGGFAGGSVLSKDDTSITVKPRNGGSQIILLTPSTEVFKNVPGTMNDVDTGKDITVTGTNNADGSVTAQMIQIRTSSSTRGQFGR